MSHLSIAWGALRKFAENEQVLCIQTCAYITDQHEAHNTICNDGHKDKKAVLRVALAPGDRIKQKFLVRVIQPLLKSGSYKDRNMYSTLRILRTLKLLTRLGGYVERKGT
jgi:hypothetical protein